MALSNDIDARELGRRRSAIYAALVSFLGEDQALKALLLWETEFSAGPIFALQGFLSRVCTDAELRARRGEVHKALVRSLSLDADQLPPDPHDRVRALAREQGEHAWGGNGGDPRFGHEVAVVLSRVMGDFLGGLEDHDSVAAHKVRVFIIDHLSPLELAASVRQALTQWLTRQGTPPSGGLGRGAAQEVLHLAYVAACQYIGPVMTDRFLAEAVKKAEGLPEARRFSPRELL